MGTRADEQRVVDPLSGAVICNWCGHMAEDPPLTWSRQASRRVVGLEEWLCDRCTRDNLRAIEGKIDEPWW